MLTNRIFLFALQVRRVRKSQNGYTQRAIKYTLAIKYYIYFNRITNINHTFYYTHSSFIPLLFFPDSFFT